MASQREIASAIESAMLLCDNVFDVMDQLTVPLVQLAILATVTRACTDKSPRSGIHLLRESVQLTPGLELEDRDEIRRVDQRFIFG